VRELASRPKGAALSAQKFAQQYAPSMSPIVDFRDEMSSLVESELKRHRDAMLTRLIGASAIALIIASVLLLMVWLFRQCVIRPLAEATQAIVAISKGNLEEYIPARAYRGEIQALFHAVNTLRAVILDRKQARDYASLIQRAILPDRLMQASLGAQHFVLWKPRDVVGGDFYIYREGEDDALIGVIDCAGHGLPGALMTMLAFAAIDQAIDSVQGHDPAAILQNTDTAMRAMLGRDQSNKALATSMEVGLVRIDRKRRLLIFSGARISLFASDGNEVREYKGARRAIGDRRQGKYHDIEVPLQDGWTFYLCTDGFLDQAGGKHGFGFGINRFTEMLRSYANRPLDEQARMFSTSLAEYQGEFAQRDDITILSFRIN
jgi:phosphoserine phosphatase RsbU/P